MKKMITRISLALLLSSLTSFSLANKNSPMGNSMAAEGKFDVDFKPVKSFLDWKDATLGMELDPK